MQCGACTVLVDGQRILSCLGLAVQYEGRAITTIEGIATGGGLSIGAAPRNTAVAGATPQIRDLPITLDERLLAGRPGAGQPTSWNGMVT